MQFLSNQPAFYVFHFIFVLLISTQFARADAINYSGAETAPEIAEIHILEDGVVIELEIYLADLDSFQVLLPDKMMRTVPPNRSSHFERVEEFSNEGLTIRDDEGILLSAELKLLEPRTRKERYSPYAGKINPVTGLVIPQAPADKRVIYVELFYKFSTKQPSTLTFTPPLDKDGVPLATIGFIAHHRNVPINDFRYLGRAETVKLNWEDAWYSTFTNRGIRRHYKDAMMSFLYIEPREIRHEALLRVKDLENWINIDQEGETQISVEEQNSLKQRVADFFASKNPLKIDGVPYQPNVIKSVFVAITPKGIVIDDNDEPIDSETAMIGVILSYRIAALPQEVTVDWQLFSQNQTRITTSVIDSAGPLAGFVEPEDPVIRWQNFLKSFEEPVLLSVEFGDERRINIPVLTIVLLLVTVVAGILLQKRAFPTAVRIGILGVLIIATGFTTLTGWVSVENPFAGTPDKTSAKRIATQLVKNLHTALAENEPARLNNALEISVSASSLTEVKPELQRALIINIQGGGSATINEIKDFDIGNVQPIPDESGFQTSFSWSIKASGNHWGHPHLKNIRFSALMDMAPVEGAWKLTGITVISALPE